MSAPPIEVTPGELERDPRRYHGARIRARGIFYNQFEMQTFAGAWVRLPSPLPWGKHLVELTGRWLCETGERRYGHMGMHTSLLEVSEIERVEPEIEVSLGVAELERRALSPLLRTPR